MLADHAPVDIRIYRLDSPGVQVGTTPDVDQKPIWITEWNPSGSSFWNGKPWYFEYDTRGRIGGNLNRADPAGAYPAIDRAEAIRVFDRDVVEKLRGSAASVNISHVFYYSYDSAAKSSKCDHVRYSWRPALPGVCVDGLIDPTTGLLLPDVAAAVAGH